MNNPSFNHGLTPAHLTVIRDILSPWANVIERVAVFGSRATGRYKTYSDIDLVIYGHGIEQKTIDRLWTLFSESSLPYKVDIVAYELINEAPFKAHIDQFNQTLFSAEDLS